MRSRKTPEIVRTDLGDRVVLSRREKHDASLSYNNIPKKAGFEAPSVTFWRKNLAAGAALFVASLAGIAITTMLALRGVHEVAHLSVLFEMLRDRNAFGHQRLLSGAKVEFRRGVDNGRQGN
jgi:hypothetical protein